MKDFWTFFGIQAVSYGIFCWNARAIAFGWYSNLVVSDLLFAYLSFTVMERIAERGKDKSRAAKFGYVMGGATGSLLSVVLTKHFLG
ncbi:MAG: hypothetical protein ABSB88_06005 [Bryobacteraceae bacterium]|jgi:hypothetical protein